jgi:hypothetical protein
MIADDGKDWIYAKVSFKFVPFSVFFQITVDPC